MEIIMILYSRIPYLDKSVFLLVCRNLFGLVLILTYKHLFELLLALIYKALKGS